MDNLAAFQLAMMLHATVHTFQVSARQLSGNSTTNMSAETSLLLIGLQRILQI